MASEYCRMVNLVSVSSGNFASERIDLADKTSFAGQNTRRLGQVDQSLIHVAGVVHGLMAEASRNRKIDGAAGGIDVDLMPRGCTAPAIATILFKEGGIRQDDISQHDVFVIGQREGHVEGYR